MKDFFIALFTRHIGTKFLALLLAFILFVFVRDQQTTTAEISQLTLQFVLSEDLASEYALINDTVTLANLTVKGKQSDVDKVNDKIASDPRREVTVTKPFLNAHREGYRIVIDADVLLDPAVLGPLADYPDEQFRGQAIDFDDLESRVFEVGLLAGQEAKLRPPADSPFGPAAGDSYQVTFSVPRVTVRGPRQLFQNEDSNRLLVEIPIIMPRPTEGDEEFTHRQPVSRIDWAASGLRSNRLDLARFVNDKSEWTAVEFAQDLKLVTKVRESAPTKDVEVVILVRDIHNKESGPTLKEFDVLSELIDNAAMERGKVTLPLKLPATLASNDAFMGQLALVLDIANATQNTAGDWSFPAFLAFRDGARHTDQRLLARIRFANTNRTVLTIELQKK